MNFDDLVKRLNEAARNDAATVWYDVVGQDAIAFAEDQLDFDLPEILKQCYTQISNGGFGPGYKLTGQCYRSQAF